MSAVLLSLLLHAALLFVVVAAGAVAARRLPGGEVIGLATGLVAAGAVAYATAIVWYASPVAGIWAARAVPAACLAYLAVAWRRDRTGATVAVRWLVVPAGLTVLWAALALGLGFLYGGYGDAAEVTATRFSWRLPSDGQLPYVFARWVETHGHAAVAPPVGDWSSSDRPPLQSAFVLAHTLWHRTDARALLDYQVLGTLLQSTWVIGVWALAVALGVRRSVAALMVAGGAACGVVVVDTFYVWPKLLAAAFALVATALVVLRGAAGTASRLGLAAAAAALAYLAHGGAAFALVPVAVVGLWQALRSAARWRSVAVGGAATVLLLAPWTAYQRYVDPPGTRLLTWMFAEVHGVDPRSPLTVVVERYREVGVGGALRNKVANAAQVLGLPVAPLTPTGGGPFDSAVKWLRDAWFFSLVPSLGLLLVLVVGWAWSRRAARAARPELRAGALLTALIAVGVGLWCLLLFGPRTTVTHQGTYAFVLLAAASLVCAGALASVRWTAVVVATQAVLTLVVYVPLRPLADAPWTASGTVARQALAVLVVALAFFVAVLVGHARGVTHRRPAAEGRHRWIERTGGRR